MNLASHTASETPALATRGVPRPWTRAFERGLERLLARVEHGSLTVVLPDGRECTGGDSAGAAARVVLHRWRALGRLVLGGDLGFAEAYRDGDWSTPDLAALLGLAARQGSGFAARARGTWFARTLARAMHRLHDNTRRGSRDNIAAHYDLGNAFYACWLDRSWQYSSALYPDAAAATSPADDAAQLESAQARKLDRVLELLDARHGQSVLEIGCGWGALACAIAGRQGARVTGLTLSREQLEGARTRAAAAGVAERVELRLEDYRDVQGQHDRIVSIEMIEAVGERWWPAWFHTVAARLAPGGHAVVQAITIDEAAFPGYRSGADFIQRHIFPGGMLPTVSLLREHAAAAGLVLGVEQRFGASYARTLVAWRERFDAASAELAALGFDERFRRLWRYYLCYCEAGFRSGRIDVGLYTLRHA